MIIWVVVTLLTAACAIASVLYALLAWDSYHRSWVARHVTFSLRWAAVTAALLLILFGFYGSLVVLAIAGFAAIQCIKGLKVIPTRIQRLLSTDQ